MKSERLTASLFHQGENFKAQEYLGAHKTAQGAVFRVWAPHAAAVFLVGDFNNWQETHPLSRVTKEGVWEIALPAGVIDTGDLYKFKLHTQSGVRYKADPYAFCAQRPPETASIFYDLSGYAWRDASWLSYRARVGRDGFSHWPMNIYEVHLGSWRRQEDGTFLSYRDLARELAPYVKQMGYTHIELMPVAEHPFDGSWGYQVTGYFAPTSRYGTPHDFMAFVDAMHEAGIGVILDWVPAHFPKDEHGLFEFDGQPLYEYDNRERMENRTWGTRYFDVGKAEVRSFLISNALFFAETYHIDGLRVDAVSSMLYLDYDRAAGEWSPNSDGGNHDPEAIAFFGKLNAVMRKECPGVLMIAEESSAFPNVTHDEKGGLGFSRKWNMGWMNDTLSYAEEDPLFRKYHHGEMTFSLTYAFSERYILPISHDEVVHGKKSFLDKMPGNYEEKFAGARAFLAWMMTHPGKKLLFMGCEIGQFCEWDYARSVEWFLLDYAKHAAMQRYVAALNHFYLQNPALYEMDDSPDGFSFIDADNAEESILSYRRFDRRGKELVVLLNLTPVRRENFRQPFPHRGVWETVFSSDAAEFGGGGETPGAFRTEDVAENGFAQSAALTLPPLSAMIFRCRRRASRSRVDLQ